MPLGTEIGFGLGHIVLDGNPASHPPPQKDTVPNFQPMSFDAKRPPISAAAEYLFIVPIQPLAAKSY